MTFLQYRKAVGARMRRARWLAGWTQQQAADRARVNFRAYCDLERGHGNPKLETMFRIAHAFGRRVTELLDAEPEGSAAVALDGATATPPRTGRPRKPKRSR